MPGKAVKDFSLPSTGGGSFKLSERRGKKLILYFYPKDNTPGCTAEGADFRDRHKESAREWRGVKVPGNAEEVLNFVKAL